MGALLTGDKEQQQRMNYLFWLEDRGISESPRPRPTFSAQSEAVPAKASQTLPAKSSVPASCRLLIVTDQLAEGEERDMVHRIASALGLQAGAYQLVLEEAAMLLEDFKSQLHILALGPGGAQILAKKGLQQLALNEVLPHPWQGHVLLIPHPRAMLMQAQLKAKAWPALQELKALLN